MSAEQTRRAWARASCKYLEEYAETLEQARHARLEPVEEQLLAGPVAGAVVAHPMSGHGVDDAALARLGAAEVIGLDYSPAAVETPNDVPRSSACRAATGRQSCRPAGSPRPAPGCGRCLGRPGAEQLQPA